MDSKEYYEETEKNANVLLNNASNKCNSEIKKAQDFYSGYQQGIEDLLRCIREDQY